MEKEELLKKYIDEIKTHRFYELIPNLMNGEFVIIKSSIDVDRLTYRSFWIEDGKVLISDRDCYHRQLQICWQYLVSDGFITEKDLNWAVEMCDKTYESMQKGAKEDTRTDEINNDDKKLFRRLTRIMLLELYCANVNETQISKFARAVKEMDDIISKRENK